MDKYLYKIKFIKAIMKAVQIIIKLAFISGNFSIKAIGITMLNKPTIIVTKTDALCFICRQVQLLVNHYSIIFINLISHIFKNKYIVVSPYKKSGI